MSEVTLRETEELQVLLLEERHRVPDALREDRLEVRAESRVRVARGEERLRHVRERRARVPKDGRPLLDLLKEVLREQRRVTAARDEPSTYPSSPLRNSKRALTRSRARPASSGAPH